MQIIGGTHRNRPISSPKSSATRPTASNLRETLFNICQNEIEGARFLDLFAGSGAIGLEALSRGAAHTVFVDNNREAIRCIKENLKKLELEDRATVLYGNSYLLLEKMTENPQKFDIIYADPPYNTPCDAKRKETYSQAILNIIDQKTFLAPHGTLFIEESKEVKIPLTPLQNLTLKSQRRIGQSLLYQFILL
jgi:16S rRNA (guanine966-N2)-methyltransferase